MKYPSAEYNELVEGFRNKISGNVSSEKMTESECQAEIAKVTEGVFIPGTNDTGPAVLNDSGTVAKEGIEHLPILPKRRGRPKGSKNKPKVK